MKNVTVVGAGLVGSLWSLYLAKRGYSVDVYERRPDPRKSGRAEGRSINLALSDRGWAALEQVGMAEAVRKEAIPMYRRVMHDVAGNLSFQPYGKENQAIYSVSRGGLNRLLVEAAESHPEVRVHFGHACVDADVEAGTATFSADGETITSTGTAVFATDGAFSKVRAQFQRRDRFNYQQEYIEHGYKELHIPPGQNGSHQIEREALHIWPRGKHMLIGLPNPDGSFTCTLFFPMEGPTSFDALQTPEEAEKFFQEVFADALALMPDFQDQWAKNPVASLVIIRCSPWNVGGKTVLFGDASHAIVPFYGQGMNSGFEDCRIFDALLEAHNGNFETAFPAFSDERKPHADAIAELAMRNFVEMRDLTAQPEFLLQKKIEAAFSAKYPGRWMPLYSQVTFSHIPYAEALAAGKRQEAIMQTIMARPDIEATWNSDEVMEAILAQLG
ncbi:MAG TPA: kynurenine 3-monooxygenase [Cryomorphaceae bacterium]|nr:kynurenine 3-monooxygenase [Cryomorphaceae bacterium]